nr:immunoglobulin light chain junction region [Macaca mulatta]MOV72371.1 immunoglobulin light chain junction region [Macaca mulatta]MOV72447.1 immunoglobulin light chain junction region [Macaca mulatta]MOV72560.1 immunoglobulin light chain junction region [Macaca mulatta]MOV72698.1 immunoglobulin light chain junction region [Macaca mulatta]
DYYCCSYAGRFTFVF